MRSVTPVLDRSPGTAGRSPQPPRSLDRSSPLPLWSQLVDDLRLRVARGEFDQAFPTESILGQSYGVSRQTVREALRHLTQDGLLIRERGRGTTLAVPQLEQPLHALYSLAQSVTERGWREHSEVRGLSTEPAGVHAAPLELDADDPVLALQRLRFAADEPLSFDRSWLPADLAGGLVDADLSTGMLYDHLVEHCEVRVTGGTEVIRPRNPTSDERRLLHLPRSEAIFQVERLVFAGDRPVEFRISHIRGDRYAFRAEWPGHA